MSRLLTIFREDKDGAQDMDVAMLRALMKASQSMDHMGNENWAYQLKLAVLWNHLDIAKSDIFNSEWNWKPEDLYPALTVALIENRPNFVQLFLDQGVRLQDYVTEKTLIQLYNNIETTFVFHQKLEKIMFKQTKKRKNENEEGVNLDHIEKALRSLLGKFPKLVDSTPEPTVPQAAVNIQSQGIHDTNGQCPSKVKYPIRVLLIWAVLQNRGELAEILWTQCQDCIVGALACSKILRALSKEEKDTNNKTAMKALADRFEERASGVFSECCGKNKVRAEQLLTRRSLGWGETTCMELATNAKAMNFMSNGGVQKFLTKIWWGKLSVDNSLTRLLFCMVFFPLIYTGFITFRSKKSGKLSTWQHLCYFITAPVVIFYYNVASYLGFLWLFAYVLMMDFQDNPSRNEYLLYVWSLTLVCEEVRQLLYDHEDMRFVTKVRMYITEFWNQMDVVAIGLFIAGLAVRCIAHSPYAGRVILAVDFIVFCLRLMHIFTLSKVLGPKIIMLQRMTKDIFFFLFLLAVWIVSFGVSKQAIIVHNEQRLDWIFRSVLYQPYLTLFGQIPTDVDKTHFNDTGTPCTADGSEPDKPKCAELLDGYPMFPEGLTIVLHCLYLLFANILLLNLLIAMFSHTFSKVQENTDQIWKFQRYKLIKEYSNRPPAPPPFIILNLLKGLVTKFIKMVSEKLNHDEKRCKHELDDYETIGLLSWEKYMKEDYLLNQQEEQSQSTDMKTRATSKKVDALAKLFESEQKRARAMEQQVFQSLNWIMKSLTENGSASEEKAPVMVHQKSIEAEEPTTGDKRMYSKCEYHVNSRQLMYPNSNVQRFPVPDELVPWQVDFPLYDPPSYMAKIERQETHNPWIESTGFQPKREYTEKDGLLLNPEGRTGIKGLGSQMWYGPNPCLHPVLTRWKRTENGSFVWKDSKKVLEVLAVKREGSERWVLPGGRLRPDEKLPSTLKDILKEEFWETFEALLENGTEVYKGYLDDPRNTDNAWVEIHTVNVHLESPEDLDLLELNLHILESADSIRWQMVDEKILLYANMKDILQQVARKLDAHY
ncbi:transient receptor potential cation channel subfamily M member 2-like [Lissotriton helveticus]